MEDFSNASYPAPGQVYLPRYAIRSSERDDGEFVCAICRHSITARFGRTEPLIDDPSVRLTPWYPHSYRISLDHATRPLALQYTTPCENCGHSEQIQ